MEIWRTRKVSLWTITGGEPVFISAGSSCITRIEWTSETKRVCQYCGHEIETGNTCPGCSARKTKDLQVMQMGTGIVTLAGFMPFARWMLNPPNNLIANIRECSRADVFDNWKARIRFTNCVPITRLMDMADLNEDEVIKTTLELSCQIEIIELQDTAAGA